MFKTPRQPLALSPAQQQELVDFALDANATAQLVIGIALKHIPNNLTHMPMGEIDQAKETTKSIDFISQELTVLIEAREQLIAASVDIFP